MAITLQERITFANGPLSNGETTSGSVGTVLTAITDDAIDREDSTDTFPGAGVGMTFNRADSERLGVGSCPSGWIPALGKTYEFVFRVGLLSTFQSFFLASDGTNSMRLDLTGGSAIQVDLRVGANDYRRTITTTETLDALVHLVVVIPTPAAAPVMYENGSLATVSSSTAFPTILDRLYFGAIGGVSPTSEFTGGLFYAASYSGAATADDVTELYQQAQAASSSVLQRIQYGKLSGVIGTQMRGRIG